MRLGLLLVFCLLAFSAQSTSLAEIFQPNAGFPQQPLAMSSVTPNIHNTQPQIQIQLGQTSLLMQPPQEKLKRFCVNSTLEK